jgi:hypothetical protein
MVVFARGLVFVEVGGQAARSQERIAMQVEDLRACFENQAVLFARRRTIWLSLVLAGGYGHPAVIVGRAWDRGKGAIVLSHGFQEGILKHALSLTLSIITI